MPHNKYNAGDTVEIIDDVDSYGRFSVGDRGHVMRVIEKINYAGKYMLKSYEYDIRGIQGPVAEIRLQRVSERQVVERYEPHVDSSPWNRYSED